MTLCSRDRGNKKSIKKTQEKKLLTCRRHGHNTYYLTKISANDVKSTPFLFWPIGTIIEGCQGTSKTPLGLKAAGREKGRGAIYPSKRKRKLKDSFPLWTAMEEEEVKTSIRASNIYLSRA